MTPNVGDEALASLENQKNIPVARISVGLRRGLHVLMLSGDVD